MGAFGRNKISVLIATRERPERLRATLGHLRRHAEHKSSYEVLLRIDEDDPTSYADIDVELIAYGPRFRGYVDLHLFYNQLAKVARGQWLYLFGDDAEMLTPGWDSKILDAEKRCVLDCGPDAQPWQFPCVHQSLVEAVDHISLNAHYDSWWRELSRACEIDRDIGIRVKHQADSAINDSKIYDSEEMRRARKADIEKLRAYLAGVA